MKFDYVDIGTCDFDTSADVYVYNNNVSVLLVEPLEFYLNRNPLGHNIIKANLAVGNTNGYIDVKFVPEEMIEKYNLPHWVKGCSNVGEGYHTTIYNLFNNHNLPLNLIETRHVEIVTFKELCSRYNVESIVNLKIDTEGYEQYILPGVIDMIKNGFYIDYIKYENQESLGNKKFVDALTKEFLNLGYYLVEDNGTDTAVKKL